MSQSYHIVRADLSHWLNWAIAYGAMESYFHALFSDWTYNLESIKKRYGKPGSAPPGYQNDGAFQRRVRGFMNQEWDGDIGYRQSTWSRLRHVLIPGALTASFSHARTWHRLATAAEDARYNLESSIFGWFYGSGNPSGTKHPDFEGYEYGNPLKPAIEPIIMGYAPFKGTVKANARRNGTGLYNFGKAKEWMVSGRYPTTFVQVHHPECQQYEYKPVRNNSGSVSGDEPSSQSYGKTLNVYGHRNQAPFQAHGNEDGVEMVPNYKCHPDCPVQYVESPHYFLQLDWRYELAETLPVFYSGKVQPSERNAFCDELELKTRQRSNPGGWANDKKHADTQHYNHHPTLKPISLCKWIAELLLPPAEFAPRRIIVPCSGTGSEIIGCLLAGWEEVYGIELTPEYADIADVRVAGWLDYINRGFRDVDAIIKQWQIAQTGQLSLI